MDFQAIAETFVGQGPPRSPSFNVSTLARARDVQRDREPIREEPLPGLLDDIRSFPSTQQAQELLARWVTHDRGLSYRGRSVQRTVYGLTYEQLRYLEELAAYGLPKDERPQPVYVVSVLKEVLIRMTKEVLGKMANVFANLSA
ncbi:hypothetical protein JW766_03265 [Candidatus Dojkabacteria bacterium]|nr:hypothetical protein [Candidatus Dojkabacteria bacterium]